MRDVGNTTHHAGFGRLLGLGMKSPAVRGFLHAPEKPRTSTDQSVHKALNLDPFAEMGSQASTARKLDGFLNNLGTLDGVDVATCCHESWHSER